jgi:hypothetical protein
VVHVDFRAGVQNEAIVGVQGIDGARHLEDLDGAALLADLEQLGVVHLRAHLSCTESR